MSLDMNLVAQQLDQIVADGSEMARAHYDMYFNPAPLDVAVKKHVNGVLTTVTMPNRAKVQTWYAETIPANMTLRVPQDYATIQAALAWLASRRIAATATVTIQVADGEHAATQINYPPHPDGDRIAIIGNPANPAACRLDFPAGHMGILFNVGSRLGYLDGLTLAAASVANSGLAGMFLTQNVVCTVGSIAVEKFAQAIRLGEASVLNAGKIVCTGGVSLLQMGVGAVFNAQELTGEIAAAGYGIYAKTALAWISKLAVAGPGSAGTGIDALWGSRVLVETAAIHDVQVGAMAYYGSYIDIVVKQFANCGVETSPAAGVTGNYNSFINVIS